MATTTNCIPSYQGGIGALLTTLEVSALLDNIVRGVERLPETHGRGYLEIRRPLPAHLVEHRYFDRGGTQEVILQVYLSWNRRRKRFVVKDMTLLGPQVCGRPLEVQYRVREDRVEVNKGEGGCSMVLMLLDFLASDLGSGAL